MATIDADAHVIETDRTWEYMAGSETAFRPLPMSPGQGQRHYWLIDGRLFSRGVNVNQDIPAASREMQNIELRLKHMDELDIDIQVLYPSLFLRPLTKRPEVEVALCKSYNRWLADICSKGKGRFRWVAVLPLMSLDRAIAEVKFAKENGACGLFTRGIVDEKLLSDPYFFPLYTEAERFGLPICVHASTGNFDWVELFQGEAGFSRFKLPVLSAFHSIVHDGVPQKFPQLRFGFIEVRAQWIPYLVVELTKRLESTNRHVGASLLSDNRIYVACQTDDDLPYVLKYSGDDHLVIGSDYGHADTSSEIEALRKLRLNGVISPAVIDKILYDNAKALYQI